MQATPAILCQRIIEVQPDFDEHDPALDLLDINWKDLDRRALARQSRQGRSLRLILGADQKLAHGAVLWRDQDRKLIVHLLPCQVIVIDSLAPLKLARLAYAIGNLHLPAEIRRKQIILPADEPTEAAIGRLNVRYSIDTRRIHPISDYLPRVTVALNTTD
jgi:urease accessory protein